jgi:hypothetical protein
MTISGLDAAAAVVKDHTAPTWCRRVACHDLPELLAGQQRRREQEAVAWFDDTAGGGFAVPNP